MSYHEVMDMPIVAFWTMNSMVARVSAEFDIRKLTVGNASQSAEGSKQVREHLVVEMGDPYKANPMASQAEEGAINKLRDLAG